MAGKPIRSVDDFEVYQKAVKLFRDFLRTDLPLLQDTFAGRTLAKQQLRCLDSICADMEEGYERKAGKELKNFFRISKGSAAEAKGRHKRLDSVLPRELVEERVEALGEIRAMLHALIRKWT